MDAQRVCRGAMAELAAVQRQALDLCVADDGSHWRALWPAGLAPPPEAECLPLLPLQAITGAAAGEAAPWLYVVETDVLPAMEAEFHAWYEHEHLPGLAAVPGVVGAQRWRRADGGGPAYHACYELAQREALGSPPWLAVRATPWSTRVRAAFRATRRVLYRRLPRA